MTNRIWLTSDLHLCHDREFIYKPRGFDSVEDMNAAIVEFWNQTVRDGDTVYLLGDVMLKDNEVGLYLLSKLKGHIHIILGNHDTDVRRWLYASCPNVDQVSFATRLKYDGYKFFLSHYPTITGSLEKDSLKKCTCNFYGHTHQKNNFYQEVPFMYHVGVNSHYNTPVCIDEAIEDMKKKWEECKNSL